MPHLLRLARGRQVFAMVALSVLALAAGCTETTSDAEQEPEVTPDTSKDAGKKNDDASTTPTTDAGTDAKQETDACADGGCGEPSGCAAHPQAAFCDDFDSPDALTPNKTKWDFVEPTEQPVATLSTVRAVSTPNSLLSRVIDKDTPGAKFAKTVTKAGFTEVTWAYDIYLDKVGTEDGFFLDDFQFSDAAGPDTFGFRLVMFAKESLIDQLKVEHNRDANGGNYVIEDPLAAGTVELGKWHHFEQTVKFTFATADGGDGAADKVLYSLKIDGAATPAFQKEYPGITREQATFARIAGMPLVFNKERSAGLAIHWDNHLLEMK